MSGEKETLRRVQDGLFHLQKGLRPFVEARMKGRFGANWLPHASRSVGGDPKAQLDAYGLLKTIIDNWHNVFGDAFGRADKQKVRNFTSVALEARNAISHLAVGLQDDETLRYLDAMHHLLKLVKAPTTEISELKDLYDAQRKSGAVAAKPPVAEPVGQKLDLPGVDAAGKSLKPWIEVALPHPDVLANRFKEAEFAADLFAVDSGKATEDYAQPESFYRITFLTEGLKRILTTSLQRLAGTGGDPVVGLQTSFGGGKTHTMLAVYHLGQVKDLNHLEGLAPLVEAAGVKSWKRPKVAAFVGTSKGPDAALNRKDGPQLYTLWGYIAWRLAGDEGLKLVAESEAARTNPGSELMVEVLRLAGPSIILLDELVAFARQLPEDRFEAFLSFIQSLTEAAKMVPTALVVGSLPESDSEVGGQKGREALLRLEKVFGRVQSPWLPASGDETYEIIRRRLFQPLEADGEKARDETVKAFHDLYRKNQTEFPPETKEKRYEELLRLSYPIHPELFERLSKDWASLEKFQRTRGVLRFMANVVGVLWHSRVSDPLITPARVPVAHERVRASVLYPLDPAFGAIVDKEVDGDASLPARIEAVPGRRISQARAATRAGRAVFLCSAPLVGQPNAGLTARGLRLACAEPGDQLEVFGDALRELAEQATYLYEQAGRYWFSTQPTLNRLADDRAKALPGHEVDEAIVRVLRQDASQKGGFHRVHAAPDDPITIEEANVLSLVILGPGSPHAGKGTQNSSAIDVVTDTLLRCRATQRQNRNSLIFVAADEALLVIAREVMRKAMAWEEIAGDEQLKKQLPSGQISDAREKAKNNQDAAQKAIRSAWNHILYPVKSETAGKPFDLDHDLITARNRDEVPVTVYSKKKADGFLQEKLGADRLWLALNPIWPSDRAHLGVDEVAGWFSSFVYLPKLRDSVALRGAIQEAVSRLDPEFGYADGFDESTGRYQNLTWARSPPETMPPSALLVRAAEALEQLKQTADVMPTNIRGATTGGTATGATTGHQGSDASGGGSKAKDPCRFFGSVEIDTVRPAKAFEAILNNVITQLQRTEGVKLTLRLEIEAEAPNGFPESEVGVIRDNAKQLKFRTESTGFEQ